MINKELLQKRLNAFYINWIQHKKELWGDSDIIVIHNTNISYSKSSNFLSWLLGDDFTNTTAIFTPYGIYFFCTHENFSKLRELCSCVTLIQKLPTSVQVKDKDDDEFLNIDVTIRDTRTTRDNKINICDANKDYPFVVGYIEGEYPNSKIFLNCINETEPMKYQAATVNFGLAAMYNIVDEQSNRPFVCFDETISANKPMVQDQNMQGKGCGDKFTPVIDDKMDNSISSTSSVMDVTSETYERHYFTSSSRKDFVILDHDNDDEDWMLIEGKEEGQERNLAYKFSWRRWIINKTTKSFGFRDLRKINASH